MGLVYWGYYLISIPHFVNLLHWIFSKIWGLHFSLFKCGDFVEMVPTWIYTEGLATFSFFVICPYPHCQWQFCWASPTLLFSIFLIPDTLATRKETTIVFYRHVIIYLLQPSGEGPAMRPGSGPHDASLPCGYRRRSD